MVGECERCRLRTINSKNHNLMSITAQPLTLTEQLLHRFGKELVSREELATFFSKDKGTIDNWRNAGYLKAKKLGRAVMFDVYQQSYDNFPQF